MFRMLIFAKRRQDLSYDDFVAGYESSHVGLVDALTRSGLHKEMRAYCRNYLRHGHALSAPGRHVDFDLVVEAEFACAEDFALTMRNIAGDDEALDRVNADFDRLLDRSSLRYVVVDERDGGPLAASR